MLTKSGREFLVGFGADGVGIALDPPAIDDGLTPIPYVDLSPEEAEYLSELLLHNARQARTINNS